MSTGAGVHDGRRGARRRVGVGRRLHDAGDAEQGGRAAVRLQPRPEHVEYTTTGVELFEWTAATWGRARLCASRRTTLGAPAG